MHDSESEVRRTGTPTVPHLWRSFLNLNPFPGLTAEPTHCRAFGPFPLLVFGQRAECESQKKFSRERGFSLLELVMVLVVIALVLAVSYPALLRGSATLHLRATGRDVVSTLRHARETAITQQTGSRVVLDRDAQSITLTDELGDGARSFSLPRDVKIHRLAQAGVEIAEGPLVVRFLPNGSCEDAEIMLRSETGATLTVVTDPMTGGARIVTGSRNQ